MAPNNQVKPHWWKDPPEKNTHRPEPRTPAPSKVIKHYDGKIHPPTITIDENGVAVLDRGNSTGAGEEEE